MFYEKVNLRSKKAMVDFLRGHFRYYTMNSWNRSTSYANCIKVHEVSHNTKRVDNETLFGMLCCDTWNTIMTKILSGFDAEHSYEWQIGTNGRSDGYLVLYRGRSPKGCYPGRAVDQDEDFSLWNTDNLKLRVKLVQSFDRTCDEVVETYLELCRTHKVETQEIIVPKLVQVAVPR